LKAVSALCLSLFLFIAGAVPAGAAPTLVYYLPWLGGGDVAVDSAGNAVVVSGDFLAKVSPLGELIFRRQLKLPWSYPLYVALDPAGNIYVAGAAYRSEECCVGSEANEGFVAKLGPDGTGLFYHTFISEGENTQVYDLAVDALGRAYVHFTTEWGQYSLGVSFSPAGSIDGYFGYPVHGAYLTAMALGPSGDLFALGLQPPEDDPYSYFVPFVERTDASSGAMALTVLDNSESIYPLDIAGAPGGGSVVVGESSSPIGFYIAGFGPEGKKVFSRVLNLGAVWMSDVAVTSSGEILLVGYTNSGSPPDAFVLRLDGGTGEVISSMTLGGSGNDYAEAVAAGPGGDAYVVGSFLARITENRPPDCSGATASPSVIWPANGKMIPVSILGVSDPEGHPVALKVTGISQDESGAAFSGIGSSVAQIKAERDGKGDGRVYRIQFEATDPSGASCAGEVTVCVPHDRSGQSCAAGKAGRS
jgi:hypothetical protein